MAQSVSPLIKWVLFIIFFALIVTLLVLFRHKINLGAVETYISSFGIWAPVVFICLYVIATVSFLPGSVLTLAGGLLFGPVYGTIYNLVGATLGATLAFLVARYFAFDWVRAKTGGRLKVLLDGIEKEGWKFVAVVRLVPLFPFNLLNYALGLTPIRLGAYVLATVFFILPGTITYTYIGSLGKAFIAGETAVIIQRAFIAVGLLILLAVIPWFIKRLKKTPRIPE